eukprot:gene23584-21178_t
MIKTRCTGASGSKLKFRKSVYLFTDAAGNVKNRSDLEALKDSMNAVGIKLVVAGTGFRWGDFKETEEGPDKVQMEDCTDREKNEIVLHWLVAELAEAEKSRGIPDTDRSFARTTEMAGVDGYGAVITERTYHTDDNPDMEIADGQKALKFDGGVRGLHVMCFVPKESVPRQHLLSHTYCLVAPTKPRDPNAENALRALLMAMKMKGADEGEGGYAVVLRVVRNHGVPPVTAVAWVSGPPSNRACLYLNELPFAED